MLVATEGEMESWYQQTREQILHAFGDGWDRLLYRDDTIYAQDGSDSFRPMPEPECAE